MEKKKVLNRMYEIDSPFVFRKTENIRVAPYAHENGFDESLHSGWKRFPKSPTFARNCKEGRCEMIFKDKKGDKLPLNK